MKSIDKFVLVLVASLALLLAGCGGGSSTPAGPTAEEVAAMEAMQMRAMEQKEALEEAHEALETALDATLNTQEALDAANAAHKTLSDAITAAADVSAADKATYQTAADSAMATITAAQAIFDAAEAERMAMEQEQQRMEEAAAAAAMAATAAKLYDGISAPMGDPASPAATDRAAAYNAADTPNTGDTAGTLIMVSIGNGTDTPTAVALSEDKKTTVAANQGWAGKRYTAEPDGDGMYEAMVYSNVETPTQGRKFGTDSTPSATSAFQYELNATGALTASNAAGFGGTGSDFIAARVALTGVTRTAGTETFNLPDPNPGGATNILVPGSYHGVSGTYSCVPTTPADGCSAAVAASGFTLAGGTWTFTPTDSNTRVMDSADTVYASYGWWIHTAEDGELTASAFHDAKGVPTPLVDATFNALQGTATYNGGAAGKYALSSTTGGTNDAGHFTARATLEADFGDATDGGTIAGTIDNFMGADGMARDWSVELKEATITAATPIATIARTDPNDTVWTIGETAASASGEWSGSLHNQGTDGVPSVATGTFYTEYGTGGKMVGAFGVNED